MIQQDIKEQKLERVVVASCSPRMHEPTFQNAVSKAGLNPFYFAMVNIREHVSWVVRDKEQATAKGEEARPGRRGQGAPPGGALLPHGAGHARGPRGGRRHRRHPIGPQHRRRGVQGLPGRALALHRRPHGPARQDLPYPRLQHLNTRAEDDGCRSASQHHPSHEQRSGGRFGLRGQLQSDRQEETPVCERGALRRLPPVHRRVHLQGSEVPRRVPDGPGQAQAHLSALRPGYAAGGAHRPRSVHPVEDGEVQEDLRCRLRPEGHRFRAEGRDRRGRRGRHYRQHRLRDLRRIPAPPVRLRQVSRTSTPASKWSGSPAPPARPAGR